MARQAESVETSGLQAAFDDPALIRAQLARMSEAQLRRLLIWLDQRGASAGKTFAVHQADPRDPGSRDLIELQVEGFGQPALRPKLRLPVVPGRRLRFGLAARA